MPDITDLQRLSDADLDRLARAPDVAGALAAIKQLEERRSPLRAAAFDALLRARGTAPKVKRTIAALAGKEATPQSAALLGLALADRDDLVVRNAARALGEIGAAADLQRLEALPPRTGEAQRAVDFAKCVLSYRHRLGKYRLQAPPPAARLAVQGGFDLGIQAAAAARAAQKEAAVALGGLALADAPAALLDCHGVRLLLAFTDGFPSPAAIDALPRQDARPLVLLHAGLSVQRFVLAQHIFTQPAADGTIDLLGARPGGALTYAGKVTPSRGAVAFEFRSVGTRYAPAIDFAGVYTPRTGEWTFERRRSSERVAAPAIARRAPTAL